jgi:1-acyl-sn-glycerol-3-phosphate acyltransferase
MENPPWLWKLAQCFCRIVTTCCFDLKVVGLKNFPRDGGVLLVANHQSYLDPVLVGVRLSRPLSYIAKSELFENHLADRVLRWLGSFPVRQGSIDVRAVRETITRLRCGRALAIFPEGSRTENGEMLPLERGVGFIVRRAKVSVIPVVIDGSYHAWPMNRTLFRPWQIRIVYGPPMQLSDLSETQIRDVLEKTLHEMLQVLRHSTNSVRRLRWAGGDGADLLENHSPESDSPVNGRGASNLLP